MLLERTDALLSSPGRARRPARRHATSLCIFESDDITRLFSHSADRRVQLNDCPCCCILQSCPQAKVEQHFQNLSYCYFSAYTRLRALLPSEELWPMACATSSIRRSSQNVSKRRLLLRDDSSATISSHDGRCPEALCARFSALLSRSLSAHSLMAIEKLYRTHDRRDFADWAADGCMGPRRSSHLLFVVGDHLQLRPPRWPRAFATRKQVGSPRGSLRLHKFIREQVKFYGKLVVPEVQNCFNLT